MPVCTALCHTLFNATLPTGGTYTLLLWLPTAQRVAVGRLGHQQFPSGYYTYTGSAKRNLVARLHRHLHGATTCHWHIDYLRPYIRVLDWQTYPEAAQPECHLNRQLAQYGRVVAARFGSSDCSCASHLLYYPGRRRPPWTIPEPV